LAHAIDDLRTAVTIDESPQEPLPLFYGTIRSA